MNPANRPTAAPTAPLKVLLVDDNPTFLTALQGFLHTVEGLQVVGVAQDGAGALRLAQSTHPDLVLLDVVMPDLNGLQVAQTLRDAGHPPKILFLSMHDNAQYRKAAHALGAMGLVGKGNVFSELLPILNTLTATPQRRAADAS